MLAEWYRLLLHSMGGSQFESRLGQLLEIINTTTSEFKEIPSIDKTVSSRYHLKIKDVQEWLSLTEWSQEQLSEKVLNKVQNQLFELGIIDKKSTFVEIVKAI